MTVERVRMTCDHAAHRGQVVARERADSEWRGCMHANAFTVAAFTLRPRCRKCDNEGFRWEFREVVGQGDPTQTVGAPRYEHLHLTCGRCGAALDMETREAK